MDADELKFTRKTVRDSWTVLETDFFVQCYNLYKNEIGKNKEFKSKKSLFSWIAGEMATSIQSTKTDQQLSSRFYILTRQNKKSVPVISDVTELPWTQISSDNLALYTSTSGSVVNETSINMSGASAVDINYASINKASFVDQTELASMVDVTEELVIYLDDVSTVDMNGIIAADENETSTFDADESAVVAGTKAPIDPINVGIGSVFNKNNRILLDNTGSSNVTRSFENVPCTSKSGAMNERPIMRIAGSVCNKSNRISLDNTGSSNVTRSFENGPCTSKSGATSERPIMRVAGALSVAGCSSSAQTSSCASSLATIGECSNSSRTCSLARSSDRATSLIDTAVLSQSADNWTTDETKFLLEQYYYYVDEVSPMKTYRTKKDMWIHVAEQMADIYEKNWTWEQLSKRVKTVIDRKKTSVERNRKSGGTRIDVKYEEEINKITAVDDSIEPEVLRGINFVRYKEGKKKNDQPEMKKPRWDKPNKKGILNTLSETMHLIETRRSEKDKLKEEKKKRWRCFVFLKRRE